MSNIFTDVMKIALSGASGFIGNALSEYLQEKRHVVVALSRKDFSGKMTSLSRKLDGVEGVINLAGAPVLKRWSPRWKNEIYSSRVDTTRMLTSAINGMKNPPSVFLSASAVGVYDAYEVHDEYSSAYGLDFLAQVCLDWEAEALKVDKARVRLAILRLGMVLSPRGGALKPMLWPFKMGLGGKIGHGYQMMPFIHLEDLLRAIEWLLVRPGLLGVFNLVAPHMVSNREFTHTLAKVLHRPAFLTVPVRGLKMLYGEGAGILSQGQKVIPVRLQKEGFQFHYPDLESTLTHLLSS